MKLKLKEEHKGQILSNSKIIKPVNTNDMSESDFVFYFNNGFAHIFELIEEVVEKKIKKTIFKPKARGKNDFNQN